MKPEAHESTPPRYEDTMAGWNIEKKLFAAIGMLAALLVVTVTFSFWSARAMKAELDDATQVTAASLDLALRTERDAVALSGEQRALLLAGLAQDQAGLSAARDTI